MVSAAREIHRGEIWWADLPQPRGSEPGFRRPVLVIQADSFNRSAIQTVIVAVITSNLRDARLVRNEPIVIRKRRLRSLISTHDPFPRRYLSHLEGEETSRLFDLACRLILEGIVLKPKSGLYGTQW